MYYIERLYTISLYTYSGIPGVKDGSWIAAAGITGNN